MSGKVPKAVLPTAGVDGEELFWQWRRGISPYFESVPLHDTRDRANNPHCEVFHLGSFLLYDTRFKAQKFLRDQAWGRREDAADHIVLQAFLSGSNTVFNGGREYVQERGNICVVNLARDVEAVSTDCDVKTLILPREWINGHVPGLGDACGVLFAKGGVAATLLTDFMGGMRRSLDHATADDIPALTDSLLGLLAPLVSHAEGGVGSAQAQAGTFLAVCRHIEGNLRDMALDGEAICARFNLSRSTLYRIFKDHGGVQAYIQRRRLMACFKAMMAPGQMHRQIYDVALDFGFGNPSHFSTLFRKHFGMSPRDARVLAREHAEAGRPVVVDAPESDTDHSERMRRWAKTLIAGPAE